MQVITSKDNELIKHVRKLKDKKYRDQSGEFIIEGINLIKEAISENADIKKIIICEDCEKTNAIPKTLMYDIAKYDCEYVSKKVLNSITQVVMPQGVFAIVAKNDDYAEIDCTQDVIIALDNLQDPGNFGTILRTIDSIGLTQVLVSKGTVDVYNPKVVRSTMGAIFRVKVIEAQDLIQTMKNLRRHKFKIVVTTPKGAGDIYSIDYKKKIIVIGNEANGVSENIVKIADENVRIPMLGKAESLNASVATGIVLYEYVRQKFIKNK